MAPVADEGLPLFYLTIVLLALSWVSVIARIVVRGWRKTLGLDDWLMCAGLVHAASLPSAKDLATDTKALCRFSTL